MFGLESILWTERHGAGGNEKQREPDAGRVVTTTPMMVA